MTTDPLADLAAHMALQPGPDEWALASMRRRLRAAMEPENPALGRVRARSKGGYLSAVPETMKFSLTIAVVVVLVVAVFLVPVPRLFHFGSGGHPSAVGGHGTKVPSTVVSAAGPGLSHVAAHFDPLAVSSVGTQDVWVLGSVPCGQKTCPAIVRTTDDGTHFLQVVAPQARIDTGNESYQDLGIYFADASHGWIYGPGLWATDDGGETWTEQAVQGTVMSLGGGDGHVYALVCTKALAACPGEKPTMELLRSTVSGGSWRRVSLPVPLFFDASLEVHGDTVVLTSGLSDELGDHPTAIAISTNKGASFATIVSPCFVGLGGHVYLAVTGGKVLWAACPTGMEAEALRSSDDGRIWHKVTTGGFDNALTIAPASAAPAIIWPAPPAGGLGLTTDGGDNFRTVFGGKAPDGGMYPAVIWAGYSTASRAYLLESLTPSAASAVKPANELWKSNDGGLRWTQVRFSS